MIAEGSFSYRIEFIPKELIPRINHVLRAQIKHLSHEERERIADWIGSKSGPWAKIWALVAGPRTVSRTPADKLLSNVKNSSPDLKLVQNNDRIYTPIERFAMGIKGARLVRDDRRLNSKSRQDDDDN